MWRQMLPQVRNVEKNNMKKTVIMTKYRGAVTDFLESCNKASGSIKCGTIFCYLSYSKKYSVHCVP